MSDIIVQEIIHLLPTVDADWHERAVAFLVDLGKDNCSTAKVCIQMMEERTQLRRQLAEAEAELQATRDDRETYAIQRDAAEAKLALAEQQREIFKTAFLLMNEEYDPTDHLCGNGCWHGIKPARNCPSERCKDAAMHKAVDAAIAAGEGK